MAEKRIDPITQISLKEFQEMCNKAGIKREALCDTVFTRQFKKEGEKDGDSKIERRD